MMSTMKKESQVKKTPAKKPIKKPTIKRPAKSAKTAKITPSKPKPIIVSEVAPGVWMTNAAISKHATKKPSHPAHKKK